MTIPAITEFRDQHSFYSNFHPAAITFEDAALGGVLTFPSSEHFFQCYKHVDKPELFHQLRNHPMKGLKALARSAPCRPDWESMTGPGFKVKDQVMLYALVHKFYQHSDLLVKMMADKGKILIEGNWWHDNYWGDCMCTNKTGHHPECLHSGLNRLGFLLMYVREYLSIYQ